MQQALVMAPIIIVFFGFSFAITGYFVTSILSRIATTLENPSFYSFFILLLFVVGTGCLNYLVMTFVANGILGILVSKNIPAMASLTVLLFLSVMSVTAVVDFWTQRFSREEQ